MVFSVSGQGLNSFLQRSVTSLVPKRVLVLLGFHKHEELLIDQITHRYSMTTNHWSLMTKRRNSPRQLETVIYLGLNLCRASGTHL
jgi:hypothetical protein